MRSMQLILNANAATDLGLRAEVAQLRKSGHDVRVAVSWETGDTTRFAQAAAQDGIDVVVACGGDGTLNEVANGVVNSGRSDCAVGLMPYGTANDFATSIGLTEFESIHETLSLIPFAEPSMIDLGTINGSIFVNVATGGFPAEVTTSTPHELKARLGGAAYFFNGLANLSRVKPLPIQIDGDFEWAGEALVICVGNGRQTGGGRRVCPHAELNDGRVDLAILPDLAPQRILSILNEREAWADAPDVVYKQVQNIQIRSKRDFQFNLDGEPLRAETFEFGVLPQAIPFFVPVGSPR